MIQAGHFIQAGALRTYYEEYGNGPPLVLLHGDGFTLENFTNQVPAFSKQFRVLLPERRGHGRTQDLPGDYTYEVFAEDTIAFLDALGVKEATLLGESGGADIALLVAIERPDLVCALIVISGESRIEVPPDRKMAIRSRTVDDLRKVASLVVDSYERVTPDGRARFPAIFEKLKGLWTTDWEVPDARLRSLAVPTLIMVADHDFGSVEDAAALSRKIPNAELCVVPGTTHGLLLQRPELANAAIQDFLARRIRAS
mgnify:CR=1 FL=1